MQRVLDNMEASIFVCVILLLILIDRRFREELSSEEWREF